MFVLNSMLTAYLSCPSSTSTVSLFCLLSMSTVTVLCVVNPQLFVKGVVNQEEQQEVPYPEVLHCVFCGACGLFMDCLIRNTSAHILVKNV